MEKKNKHNSKKAFTVGRRHSVGIRPDMTVKVIRPQGASGQEELSCFRFSFALDLKSEIKQGLFYNNG
jgi:hypothetical protein